MNSRQYTHPTLEEITLEQIFSALSDPVRLQILKTLSDGAERDSITLAEDLPRSTLSYHTRKLRECGLTWTRSQGRSCLISLREEINEKFPGLLEGIVRNA